jgi:hypothetical protein
LADSLLRRQIEPFGVLFDEILRAVLFETVPHVPNLFKRYLPFDTAVYQFQAFETSRRRPKEAVKTRLQAALGRPGRL